MALSIGLRFARSDAKHLREIAQRLRSEPRGDADTSLFDKAAQATEHGDALTVLCDNPDEAVRMADGFTLWGIQRPAIES